MPSYKYKCKDCGAEMEELESISNRRETVPCSECGKSSPRSYMNSMRRQIDKPRKSAAMGVHPSQIGEAMRAYPGSRYDKNGHLLIANRAEKKVRLRQRGYIEYD